MKNGNESFGFFQRFLKRKTEDFKNEKTDIYTNKSYDNNVRNLRNTELTMYYVNFEKAKEIECTYDVEYLCKVHSAIYKGLYDFAGKLRNDNSGESSVDYRDIKESMREALRKLKNMQEGHSSEGLILAGLSQFLVDIKEIAPFDVGNEEVGILISKSLLDRSGYEGTSQSFFDNKMVAFFDKTVAVIRDDIKEASETGNCYPIQSRIDKALSRNNIKPGLLSNNTKISRDTYSFKKEKSEYSNMLSYSQRIQKFDLSIFCLGYIHYQLNRGEKYAGRFRDTNKIADYVKGAKYKIPDYHEITFHLNEVFKKMENTNLKNLTQEQKTELCKRYLVELLKIHPFEKENVHALTAFVEEWSNEEMIERRGFLKFHNSKDKMEKNVMLAAAEKTKQSIGITAIGNGKEIEVDISKNSGAPMTWAGYLMEINKEKKENKETGVKDLKNREEKDR